MGRFSESIVPAAASGAASAALLLFLAESDQKSLPFLGKTPRQPSVIALTGLIVGFGIYGMCTWMKLYLIRQLLQYREWLYSPKSKTTKVWGLLLAALIPKRPKLFSLQNVLPKYPLPSLKETCQRTLETVKPIVTLEEYEKIAKALTKLENEEGPPLQAVLQHRYKTENNWVIDLWNKFAYLANRKPLPVHSNFACLGDGNRNIFPANSHHLSIAANIIYDTMVYQDKIKRGDLTHMMIQGTIPICCDRYKYIFAATRIPGDTIDQLKTYHQPRHVVVIRKGLMYKLEVFAAEGEGNTLLTPRELQTQLETMMSDAAANFTSDPVNPCVFTTMERPAWAKIRQRLQSDPTNARSLELVESAAFCLSLDDDNPETLSEELYTSLTGKGFDRWFDKSLHIVVQENKLAGFNVEHSTAEATITGRMWEYMYFHARFDAGGNATHRDRQPHPAPPSPPQLLEWNLQQFTDEIRDAQVKWRRLAKDVDVCVYFTRTGKEMIKKLRVSPDGFLQMAMQLAFYRIHRVTPKTYETAATRLFKEGRTETIRPVSEHSVAFTKVFDDAGVSDDVKAGHLKRAIVYQNKYKFDAMNGRVVDRHLFGLYAASVLTGAPLPQLFTLRPFCESDRLSTSQSPIRYDPDIIAARPSTKPVGGGFGAQHPDGYGVGYFCSEFDQVHLLVTSFHSSPHTDSRKFAQAVETAIDDMQVLLSSHKGKGR